MRCNLIEPIKHYRLKKGQLHLKMKISKIIHTLVLFSIGVCIMFYALNAYTPGVIFNPVIQNIQEKYILSSNVKVTKAEAKEIVQAITKWSTEFNLDPKLMLAIARQESNFNKYAISSSGAYGIMQVIPVWHKQKVVDANKVLGNPEIFNINTNIYLGARVYSECVKKTKAINKALECYYGKPRTGYAKQVLAYYKILS